MTLVCPLPPGAPVPAACADPFGPPHASARAAAADVQAQLAVRAQGDACEGKMYGVLVVKTPQGELGYLKAFSGMLAGAWHVPGFVPPAFDVPQRQAFEAAGADVVAALLARAAGLQNDPAWRAVQDKRQHIEQRHAEALQAMAARHASRRVERQCEREALQGGPLTEATQSRLHALAQQSRADKAEVKRATEAHAAALAPLVAACVRHDRRLRACVRLRLIVCRRLMQMIFDCYVISNARGDVRPLRSLFAPHAPPSGAGDCAAPKLLAHAFAHQLEPLALAEFWWGPPPSGGGRASGSFYPPCRGKCEPLLPFMLQGVALDTRRPTPRKAAAATIVYEDPWVLVVNKPAGLLSVPGRGRNADDSLLQRMQALLPSSAHITLVHRLDEDTSGLLLAAKSREAYVALQRQFLARTVTKVYEAWVQGVPPHDSGQIALPLRLDPDDRPRQVVDFASGRSAVTDWRVLRRAGAMTLVELRPLTGRTHQLRVHCAHAQGLAAPIVGDRLYGTAGGRMWLHAATLSFWHPAKGARVTFHAPSGFADTSSIS